MNEGDWWHGGDSDCGASSLYFIPSSSGTVLWSGEWNNNAHCSHAHAPVLLITSLIIPMKPRPEQERKYLLMQWKWTLAHVSCHPIPIHLHTRSAYDEQHNIYIYFTISHIPSSIHNFVKKFSWEIGNWKIVIVPSLLISVIAIASNEQGKNG